MLDTHGLQKLSETLQAVLAPATRILDVSLIREGQRARVYRVTIERVGGLRETVILKQITDSGEQGYTDWASLAFLSELSAAADLTPKLLGGDEAGAQYLLADLGPSISLDDVLRSTDSSAAHSRLEDLARTYARLHAAALGREGRFAELRASLPGGSAQGRVAEAARWTAARPKLLEWLAALDVAVPDGLDAELDLIAGRYAEPGAWLTFTHGDPAPSNNHVSGDTVRLLDFEYGAYRHALYDLTAWEVLCPLPKPVVAAMQCAYRKELATYLPQITDDALFQEEWALLCAFRAIAILTWVPPKVLERNWPWADEWTAREAVTTSISRLAAAVQSMASLARVHQVAERAKSALLLRFPEHQDALPHWPALPTFPAGEGRLGSP